MPPTVTTDKDRGVFERAKARGQRTFTLVEQDRTAPMAIVAWIFCNIESAPAEKLREALDDAIAMREWPNRKAAD